MTTPTEAPQDPRLLALAPFFDTCAKNFTAYRTLQAKVEAATGNREAALKVWMDTADDAEAVQIRDLMARAQEKLRALADANVPENSTSPEELKRIRQELETTEKKAKASERSLLRFAENFELDVRDQLEKLGDPFLPKAKSDSPSGTSSPRPSVFVEVTDGRDTWKFDSLSATAKILTDQGGDVETLGKAFAKAAGVEYEEISKVKEATSFDWEGTSQTYSITITPKPSTRGRQPVSQPEQPATADESNAA